MGKWIIHGENMAKHGEDMANSQSQARRTEEMIDDDDDEFLALLEAPTAR